MGTDYFILLNGYKFIFLFFIAGYLRLQRRFLVVPAYPSLIFHNQKNVAAYAHSSSLIPVRWMWTWLCNWTQPSRDGSMIGILDRTWNPGKFRGRVITWGLNSPAQIFLKKPLSSHKTLIQSKVYDSLEGPASSLALVSTDSSVPLGL